MQFSGRTMLAAGIKPYSLSLPSSLARNRSHKLYTTCAAKAPPPPRPAAHPICTAKAPPPARLAAPPICAEKAPPRQAAPSTCCGVRARRRRGVRPRTRRPALVYAAMPRRKSASGGSTAAGPGPGRQAVLSRFFRSAGSLRSSASSTEPAEKVEYGSAAPLASTQAMGAPGRFCRRRGGATGGAEPAGYGRGLGGAGA